jgi:hypothetical protein
LSFWNQLFPSEPISFSEQAYDAACGKENSPGHRQGSGYGLQASHRHSDGKTGLQPAFQEAINLDQTNGIAVDSMVVVGP